MKDKDSIPLWGKMQICLLSSIITSFQRNLGTPHPLDTTKLASHNPWLLTLFLYALPWALQSRSCSPTLSCEYVWLIKCCSSPLCNVGCHICCCCCSVVKSCLTLCNPMDCSKWSFPVLHQLPEFTHSCPLSWWYHPTSSSSVAPFSSCP